MKDGEQETTESTGLDVVDDFIQSIEGVSIEPVEPTTSTTPSVETTDSDEGFGTAQELEGAFEIENVRDSNQSTEPTTSTTSTNETTG